MKYCFTQSDLEQMGEAGTVSFPHEECARRAASQVSFVKEVYEAKIRLLEAKIAEYEAGRAVFNLDSNELRQRIMEDSRKAIVTLLSTAPAPERHARTSFTEFERAVRGARRRKKKWELSEEEWSELVSQPCHYCGGHVGQTGVRLDRVNNDFGYRRDNVVPCCARCSVARGKSFTPEEMKRVSTMLWSDQ